MTASNAALDARRLLDDELVGAVVDDDVVLLELRKFRADLLEDALHQALGELHDVGFGGAGDFFAVLGLRQREGGADDALAAGGGH